MKKIIIFCLIALTTLGVYADSNYKWGYSDSVNGLYHLTTDIAIISESGVEVKKDSAILMSFSKVDGELFVIFSFSEDLGINEADTVVYAEDISKYRETGEIFKPVYSVKNYLSLGSLDSYYIYIDMVCSSQKTFFIYNSKTDSDILVFNINCDRLYLYTDYL